MIRSSRTHKSYHNKGAKKKREKQGCQFCTNVSTHTKETYENFLVVQNIHPYEYWDAQGVTEHLLLIPRKHIKSISELGKNEKAELVDLMAIYGGRGYSQYTRSEHNAMKSIPGHLHLHLIKLDQKLIKRMIFTSKPYIVKAKQ